MIALDTNILVYVYDHRLPAKQEQAMRLVAETSGGVLLWQVAVEFLSASRKQDKSPAALERAWERLNEFRVGMKLITPTTGVLSRAELLAKNHQLQL